MSLDFTPDQFRKYLSMSAEIVASIYEENLDRKVFAGMEPAEVAGRFGEKMPDDATDLSELLKKVETDIVASATMNVGPNYFGYITGGGNQVGILAEMISAALNQNNLKWHSSPVSTELEKRVLKWICQFIGYPEKSAGAILDGGSMANFNCLAVARKNMADQKSSEKGLYGSSPMSVYISTEGHSSIDKAVDILGIGRNYLRKIETDSTFRIRTDLLEKKIEEDIRQGIRPICVIGIAGTTNTGAIDPLKELADICRTYDIWYHVDAAYGGPAAALPDFKDQFTGMERADSLVVNPHKWLYVPFEAAAILVKEPDKLRRTFSLIPDYLESDQGNDGRTDLMEYQLPLTKSFKSLKVWMTLKAYGGRRLRSTIAHDIENAAYLRKLIEQSDEFECLAPSPLSILCFRYIPGHLSEEEVERLNRSLIRDIEQDGRIFLTGTKLHGKTALRTCFINPRTGKENVERIIHTIRDLGRRRIRTGIKPQNLSVGDDAEK
jgi:glutamate/tyrosine decarboxylase-like PLP-dependent enzyme